MCKLRKSILLALLLFCCSLNFAAVYSAKEVVSSFENDADFSRANLIAADAGQGMLTFFDQSNYLGYITDLNGQFIANIDFSSVGFVNPAVGVASPFRIGFFGKTGVLMQINYSRNEVIIARYSATDKKVEILPLPKDDIKTASVSIDSNGCILLATIENNKLTVYYDTDKGFVEFTGKTDAVPGASSNVEITSFTAGANLTFAIALAAPASSISQAKNKPDLIKQVKYASSVIYTGKSDGKTLTLLTSLSAISQNGVLIDKYENYIIDEQGVKRISVPLFTSMQLLHDGNIVSGSSIFDPHIRLIDRSGEMVQVKPFSYVSGGLSIALYCPMNIMTEAHYRSTDIPRQYDYLYIINGFDATVNVYDATLNHRATIFPSKTIGFLRPVSIAAEGDRVYVISSGVAGSYKMITYLNGRVDTENKSVSILPVNGVPYLIKLSDRFMIGDIVKNGVVAYNYILSNGTMINGDNIFDKDNISDNYRPNSPIIIGDNGRVYILENNFTITSLDKNGKFVSDIKVVSGLDLINVDKDGNISLLDIKNGKYAVTTFASDGKQLRWKSLNMDIGTKIFPLKLNNKIYLYVENGELYELDANMSIISTSTINTEDRKLLSGVVAVSVNNNTNELIFGLSDKVVSIKL